MKVEQLIEMGYSKIGTHNGLELWSNFYSKNGVKKGTNAGFIFQFNFEMQEESIGHICVTRELLERILEGKDFQGYIKQSGYVSCEYCEGSVHDRKNLIDSEKIGLVYITENNFLNVNDEDRCKINFCPICGKRLKK